MSDRNGWIKLHRKIMDSAVFDNPEVLKMWIWCLCKASHKGFEAMVGNQVVILQEGQFIFGRTKAASELQMSESKVYRYLKLLEKLKMLNNKTNNKFSLVTIEKWAFYQGDEEDFEQQIEQQMNNKRTTNEQQMNTYKNVKNVKKVKECKEIIYSDSPELNEAIISFIDYRKSIKKPMSDRAITLLIGKLNKMSGSINEQIDILNQSILNGWQGIFPLKKESALVRTEQVPSYIKNNSFNNFPQRHYDMDGIEKKLLNKRNDDP